jgi:hypothetical protein
MSLPSSKGPDNGQLALIKRGYGMFIHFGVIHLITVADSSTRRAR